MIRGGIFPHYQHQNQKPGFFTKTGFFCGDKIWFGNDRVSPDILSRVGLHFAHLNQFTQAETG